MKVHYLISDTTAHYKKIGGLVDGWRHVGVSWSPQCFEWFRYPGATPYLDVVKSIHRSAHAVRVRSDNRKDWAYWRAYDA